MKKRPCKRRGQTALFGTHPRRSGQYDRAYSEYHGAFPPDENKTLDEFEDVDLLKLAQSVTLRLKHKAQTKGVTLNVSGSSACVCGVQSILSEVLYNLVDNSIKYNKDNGKVDVKVQDGSEEVTVSVSDTALALAQPTGNAFLNAFTERTRAIPKKLAARGLGFL